MKHNFRPAPKRFIAWDKSKKEWVTRFLMPSTSDEDSNDWTCPLTLGTDAEGEKNWLNNDQLIIIQSTNLFDKDGKEIFEGSIVEDAYNGTLGYVYYDPKACAWRINFVNDAEEDDGWTLEHSESNVKVIGHIFSDPELLEKENV